jgi:D-inositol-3-phosphate glycosyltransferase
MRPVSGRSGIADNDQKRREAMTKNLSVTLLTGGSDKPYVHGLTQALSSIGMTLDVIGSDELDEPVLRETPGVNFLNLRGDLRPNADLATKTSRILAYYWKLIRYAATSKPKVFHILWNNKFETFDRTMLMLYYKLLGKTVVLTAHNVNASKRDSKDTFLNRLTLRIQYHLCDHIFVHTPKMKDELETDFDIPTDRVTVIPFGVNNSIPDTGLSSKEAKERLGLADADKTILFFGRIKPYKGVHYLVDAFQRLAPQHADYRLIIAGRLEEGCEEYWKSIKEKIEGDVKAGRIILRVEYVPDSGTEAYFKGTDVVVLPYTDIFQSGIIFLAYRFGLPVLAADVGSLKDDIVEGETGFVFRPEDTSDLATALERYFGSDLFANLDDRRKLIRDFVEQRHSWDVVSQLTENVYSDLLKGGEREPKTASLGAKHL